MERREFLGAAGVAAAATATLIRPTSAKAQAVESTYQVEETISANHGHALGLSRTQVIDRLRDTVSQGEVQLSIQGASGHNHDVTVGYFQLLTLVTTGELTLQASIGAGHSHSVDVTLAKSLPTN